MLERQSPGEFSDGKLIIPPVDVSPVIRKASEVNPWDYSAEAAKLYRRAEVMMDRFYHGVFSPQFPGKLPTPLIAVEPMNIRTLAAYRIVPDDYGLPFKLSFNEAHFIEQEGRQVWRFGEWAQHETLCHELGHHWQQLRGRDPYKAGKITHNREFTAKLEELGIYSTLGHGAHYRQAELDKPFGILMQEWGIHRPDIPADDVPPKVDWFKFFADLFGTPAPKGRSSLAKWECPECHLKVRLGIRGDPRLVHDPCSERTGQKVFFIQTDGLSHVIYDHRDN